jgi:phytoene synthase
VQGDLARGESRRPAVAHFLEVAARRGVPLDAAQALIDGVRQDVANPVLTTEAEVIRYGYRVAGTVGLMMCPILGVRATWAHPFAIDLGIAMQLTNIARDVIEDARRGRRYLPAALIDGDAPTPERLAQRDPAVARTVYTAVRRLLDLAAAYYRSADRGMAAIPPRPRLAIITARRVYAGIGERIRRDGPAAYWRGRAVVGPAGKLRRTAQACVQFAQPQSWPKAAPPRHESALHAAIADLPGADVPGAACDSQPADGVG